MTEQLDRILASHLFRSSARCTGLLRYVVERTTAGDLTSLKERTIGVELFSRTPDYDTSQDPVVRSTAAEVRKKLAQYYEEDAHASEPRIRMVPGAYVADINGHTGENSSSAARPRSRLVHFAGWGLFALVIVVGIVIHSVRYGTAQRTDLGAFWAPMLKSRGPVVIYIDSAVAYRPLSSETERDPRRETVAESPTPEPGPLPASALLALPGRYVHMGEVTCLVQVTSWLTSRSKPYRIVGASRTTYSNLPDTPVFLLTLGDDSQFSGALGGLRFSIEKDASSGDKMIRDAMHPSSAAPKATGASARWDNNDDYAVVTLMRRNNEAPVMIASSTTGLGSTALGEFLTSPLSFGRASSGLPRNWKAANVQIVLRIPIVHGASGVAEVVATHAW